MVEQPSDRLKRAIEGHRHRAKRPVDYQFAKRYTSSMSRVEMLAKALGGTVVEDNGYRGIIHVADRNEFVRYHATQGVHVVTRQPKTWRVMRAVLSPDEVGPFLEESGVIPKKTPVEKPLDALARAVGGEVISAFQTSGGVVKTPDGLYLRFSNITGLDVVELIVTKWRATFHVADRVDVLRDLMEDPSRIVERVARLTERASQTLTQDAP